MSTDTTGAAHDLRGDELALVLDAACAVVFHLDVASGEVRWSGSAAALTGVGEVPASLEALLERVHPDDRAELEAAVAATTPDGATSTRDLRVVWPDGSTHWLDARWRLVPDVRSGPTIVGIARKIDVERAALARVRFLADVSAALDASLDMERMLATIAELCVRDLGDWCSIDLTDADGELRNVAVAHVDPVQVELAQRMRERYPPRSRAGGGTAQVVRTGEPLLMARISEEQMVAGARDAEHLELIRSLDLTSVLIVALRARGHVLGAITLARTGRHPNYGEDDVAFVGEVAGRAALALDNARLYGEARARERDSSEAQALLDALVSAAPIGQGFLDTDFRYVRVNDALAEINGVPAIDHIGRTVREVLPGLATDIEAALEEVVATGEAIVDLQIVGETPREPGRDRHYVASYYPVALARGERLGIGITVADVTDRAEAAQALREQRDLYEALMRAQSELGLAFALLDGDRIVYANAATEALTGRSARQLYALPSILAALPLDVHRAVAGRLAGVRDGREPAELFRTEIQRPDGTRVPIETAGRRLGGPTDSRMAVIARDITDRVAQERELQRVLEVEQAARRASEAAHARVRLLADTSALLERSQTSDDALQEVAELLVARIADSCALDVLDLAGHLRRAGADARAPDGRRRHARHGRRSGGRARDAGRPADLPRGRRARAPCSGAARRSSRSWPMGAPSGCSRSAGATPGAGPRATSGASSRRSRSASRSPSTARFSTASARTWPRRCRPACCPRRCRTSRARPWPRSTSPPARGWTSAATSTTSSPSTTARGSSSSATSWARAPRPRRSPRWPATPCAPWPAARPRRRRRCGAQRRDAAPAQPRPALRHRRARPPRAARRGRRPARRGLRRPPAAGAAARRRRAPRWCRARARCWASSTTRAASTRRSSWGRATPWCSTPTG